MWSLLCLIAKNLTRRSDDPGRGGRAGRGTTLYFPPPTSANPPPDWVSSAVLPDEAHHLSPAALLLLWVPHERGVRERLPRPGTGPEAMGPASGAPVDWS